MPKYQRQRVPYFEHPSISLARRFNWEDVHVFLAVARQHSFRAAATDLGLSFNTVRRHVDRLEHQTEKLLVARHQRGVELTQDGQSLVATAEAMETAASDLRRLGGRAAPSEAGRVRISVTEGLGTFWLVPRLVQFQRAHPNIVLEVSCTFREPDVPRMESDIAIQLTRPKHADVRTVRLGRLHVMPFASREYLRTFGNPKSLKEVEDHKIVEQLSPQLDIGAVDRLFPGKPREGFVSLATNTSTAHFWAVARGAGLGMLPTYLAWLGAKVVPVDIDLRLTHDIWLSYHPDAKRLRRVSLTIEWIRENFDAKMFPCFGEDFIHPDDLRLAEQSLVADNHFASILAD